MTGTKERYRIQAHTTTNTYVYCWIAARQALAQAEKEREGCFYWFMSAGVFSSFTMEAFFNHLGQRRVRDWSVFERKSPRAKLRLLKQRLKLSVDESTRPFETFRSMIRLRNLLAHGRTVTATSDRVVDDPHDESAKYPEPDWKKLCSLASVSRMVEDAEAMVRDLAIQSGSQRDPFASPGHGGSGVSEVIDDR